jgi:Family of unknown function (DUF6209)
MNRGLSDMSERINRGKPPHIIFTYDFHQLVYGELLADRDCTLSYDPFRIVPADDSYQFGDPSRPIIAHVQCQSSPSVHHIVLQSRTGTLHDIDIDYTGQGSMLHGQFHILGHCDEVVVWFSYQDRTGRTRWDSDYGANYRFRFVSEDLKFLNSEVESGDAVDQLKVQLTAAPEIERVIVRYRIVNDLTKPTQEYLVELSPTNQRDSDGGRLWSLAIPLPRGAVVAYDVLYFVSGRRFKDDNSGRYFVLAPNKALSN